ncbi:MAG: glycosyltransferase [Thermoflexales bacterium]|nr:glycosyltransferase [Thermoflexales bacterium]
MPAALVLIALALVIGLLTLLDAKRARRLPALSASDAWHSGPLVTIIIPARNEAANLARCLDGALQQSYAPCAVIVVDDHSTDETPHILARYAAQHPDRLHGVVGRPLPPGWVGKCNACYYGASRAKQSAWLLFLDADTAPAPELVGALVAFAERHRLDAVSALPFNELHTLPEQLVLPLFYQFALVAFPLQKNLNPDTAPPNTVLANGQCLLVRSAAYWAIDGHAAVKDKVLEDVELARALRRAGFRVGLATAFDVIRVRMYRNFGEIAQGLGKHATAGRRASGWRAFWAVTRMTLTVLASPLLALAAALNAATQPTPLAFLALVSAALAYGAQWAFWAWRYHAWYRLPRHLAWLVPLGWMLYLAIVIRSTTRVWLGRGVVWKERTYSS